MTPFALLLRASKSHQVPAFFQPEYVTIRRFLGFARDHHLRIDEIIYSLIQELNGVVSAEHGIGRLKVDELEEFGDPTKLSIMRALKKTLDPKGILNPGAVLRPQV